MAPRLARFHSIVAAELVFAAAGALVYYYWPQSLALPTPAISQTVSDAAGKTVVSWPGRVFVGKLAEFHDVLPAYLIFDYIRSREALHDAQFLLTPGNASGGPPYTVWLRLPDDTLSGIDRLMLLKQTHLTSAPDASWVTSHEYGDDLRWTNWFVQSYNRPDFPKLEDIPSAQLEQYVQQFICFKASVDPRTWDSDEDPLLRPRLKEPDALAADIVQVARFYSLPVDALLGIGAMENNFLDAPGDLNNAVWKSHVETDDIVLRRRGRRALVLNSSIGTWQITRGSLRYAHELFQCDTRDYSKLPFELHPTEHLDMNFLSRHVLTTYAALLLRDLLDYFHGDVFLATAAYNGTKLRPNLQYAIGVENVASYARRVIGNTARLGLTAERKPTISMYNAQHRGDF